MKSKNRLIDLSADKAKKKIVLFCCVTNSTSLPKKFLNI